MAMKAISHMLREEKAQQEVEERWCERISSSTSVVCLKDSYPRQSGSACWDQNTPTNSPKALGTILKLVKERVHREEYPSVLRLMSVVFARSNSRRDHMRRRCTKKDAPAEQRGIWRKIFTSSRIRTKLRFTLLLKGG